MKRIKFEYPREKLICITDIAKTDHFLLNQTCFFGPTAVRDSIMYNHTGKRINMHSKSSYEWALIQFRYEPFKENEVKREKAFWMNIEKKQLRKKKRKKC